SPLLVRPREEGWTRHQEEVAKPPLMERPGWSFSSHAPECIPCKTVCGRPPRLRRIRSFAAILLVAQPPLLTRPHEEGIMFHSSYDRPYFVDSGKNGRS